jgi:hypothetical protein
MEDAGKTAGLDFMRDFDMARDAARPYFTRE